MPILRSLRIAVSLLGLLSFAQTGFASPRVPAPLLLNESGTPLFTSTRTVCGKNDMVPMLSQTADLQKMGGPIGIYTVKIGGATGKCTGTLIAKDLFLTAKHCEGECKDIFVTFGYLRDKRDQEIFACKEIVEKGDDEYNNDYMIVRLEGTPGAQWGWYEPSTRALTQDQELLMIHHPSGTPMKVSSKNCQYKGENDGLMDHRCDTQPGSSGSAIMVPDYQNPEKTRIVGVHTLGGCNEGETAYNSGPSMSHLATISPMLKSLSKD